MERGKSLTGIHVINVLITLFGCFVLPGNGLMSCPARTVDLKLNMARRQYWQPGNVRPQVSD
jgi:hypothetical protein